MIEGWHHKEYVILFDKEEVATVSQRYGIADSLPGFEILGLLGWDDFIVRDQMGHDFTVPTIPVDSAHLRPYRALAPGIVLTPDNRFGGKIKWYIKPVALGGDPESGENVIWVDHGQHAELVRWWNNLYRSLAGAKSGG